jgi:hypothetical protein
MQTAGKNQHIEQLPHQITLVCLFKHKRHEIPDDKKLDVAKIPKGMKGITQAGIG